MESEESEGSVTRWIGDLKGGGELAAQELWRRYFDRLTRLARARLRGVPLASEDEEDVALSAFDSLCQGALAGEFPALEDRDDLWRLLASITARKAVDLRRRGGRLKRGGSRYGVRWMPSVEDVGDIPAGGRNLIVVAAVEGRIHVRVFDHEGLVVADTDEARLVGRGLPVGELKAQLEGSGDRPLTRGEEDRVADAVAILVGLRRPGRPRPGSELAGEDDELDVLAQQPDRAPAPDLAALLDEQYRELLDRLGDDVLRRIAVWKLEGYGNDEIAQRLGCGLRTVERKLGVIRSIWEAAGTA
jgi:DNA-directed RNA polymerase specialized sigma24 family protein